MKKIIVFLFSIFVLETMNAQDIQLPKPDFNEKSKSVIATLQTRHSVRNYLNQELSQEMLSNLCWAACGLTRDNEHITSPTAMNRQEIRLFVFTDKGVYEYIRHENLLRNIVEGDFRKFIAQSGDEGPNGRKPFSQDFVLDAPISLLMVIDFDIFGSNDDRAMKMGCVDAGIVSENINLYCESVGLATVTRATHDTKSIQKLLGFTEKQLPILNNPVGFEKKNSDK